jgi:hypothetical protein
MKWRFSETSTFHDTLFDIVGLFNRHSCQIWVAKQPREVSEYFVTPGSEHVAWISVWSCGRTFPCAENTIKGYLPRRGTIVCFPSGRGLAPFQSSKIQSSLNVKFWYRWVGKSGLLSWLQINPDLTPLDFFQSVISVTCEKEITLLLDSLYGHALS